jgi:predicted P-loop ATPase
MMSGELSSATAAIMSAPEAPRAKRKTASVADGWRSRLIVTTDGKPRPLLANAIVALRHSPEFQGVLGFNAFSLGVAILKPTPWGDKAGTAWTDQQDRLTADLLQHQGILVGVEIAGQAVQTVAHDREFHPVRDYLDSLKWDGTKRADHWLSLYLGVEHSEYASAVGACWLKSGVARIEKPGSKADCTLITESPQGAGKSRAYKVLGGEFFADEIAELGSKDAALQTRGVWIIEIAELDSMSRVEVGRVKAFMSRSMDRFRPPYGARLVESPRQCIFAGSVNHSAYLRVETGARRFWPVQCGRIDLDALARDRDQLWAEARDRFRNSEPWWLDTAALNVAANEEQAARYEGDPWDALISEFVEGRTSVTGAELLALCIKKPEAQWTQPDMNRVSRSLRALGWERYQQRDGRKREWRYRRP